MFGYRAYVNIPKDERSKFDDKSKECIFLGYGHEEFGYRLWDPVARKLIRNKDVMFLKDHIVGDVKKSDKSHTSPKTSIIPTSVSPHVVHDDHGGTEKDNNNGLLKPPTPPVKPELRRSTRERQPSTRYPLHEYVLGDFYCHRCQFASVHKK